MAQKKVFFKNNSGQKLAGLLSIPKGRGKFPAVVFHHGFRSGKNTLKAIVLRRKFRKENFVFLSFDCAGHGRSEGHFRETTVSKQMKDLKAAIDYVYSLGFVDQTKIGVVGSSLGGMISILQCAKDNRVRALVFVAPVSNFHRVRECAFGEETLQKWKEKGWMRTGSIRKKMLKIDYSFYEDGISLDVYKKAEKIKIPALIIHGDKDRAVSLAQSKELVKHLKNSKLEVINGCKHTFSSKKHFGKMISLTVNWFCKQLK